MTEPLFVYPLHGAGPTDPDEINKLYDEFGRPDEDGVFAREVEQ